MTPSSDIRLRWVLSDPNRERAVDPIGTGMVAERIADRLVPDFSGATMRARYLSFLCSAVRRASASRSPYGFVHHLEAELAVDEAIQHGDAPTSECPGVIGRSRAAKELLRLKGERPTRPERLYKNTAFSTYRPLLRALGFLETSRTPRLTSAGEELARLYPARGSLASRCLAQITRGEVGRLCGPLGLDGRTSLGPDSRPGRRRATYDYLRSRGSHRLEALTLIGSHQRPPKRSSTVAHWLHVAYAWEVLSLGLALAFARLLRSRSISLVTRELRDELRSRPRVPRFEATTPGDQDARDVVAFLREARRVSEVLPADGIRFVQIAQDLVVGKDPGKFLRRLVEQHGRAKGGDAWVQLAGDRIRIIARTKNLELRPAPRRYRLDAFTQVLADMGRLPRAGPASRVRGGSTPLRSSFAVMGATRPAGRSHAPTRSICR
jgi:hypothetical protein